MLFEPGTRTTASSGAAGRDLPASGGRSRKGTPLADARRVARNVAGRSRGRAIGVDTLAGLRHNSRFVRLSSVLTRVIGPRCGSECRGGRACPERGEPRVLRAGAGARRARGEASRGQGSRIGFPRSPGARDPRAAPRGIEVDYRPGSRRASCSTAIADADALVIRSGTKVTAEVIARAPAAAGDRARRHRRRQRRRRGRHRARHRRDEHARAATTSRPPSTPSRCWSRSRATSRRPPPR